MKHDQEHNDFISRTRGLLLIWVIAFPLALTLYFNFPRVSVSILAFAVFLSLIVMILFPKKPTQIKKAKEVKKIVLPPNELKLIRYLRLFFIKLDRFIWNFMIMWMGPFFVGLGNFAGAVGLLQISKNSNLDPDPRSLFISNAMIFSWFFIAFCYWYMAKYHPDDYKGGKF